MFLASKFNLNLTMAAHSKNRYRFKYIQFIIFAAKATHMIIRSRRTALKIITVSVISFFIFIWNKLALTHLKFLKEEKKTFLYDQNKVVSFLDHYIIVNKDNRVQVLSSHCKHLGCKINKMENNNLVCPCHGSEFDLSGKVLKGPAYKNLDIIPFKIISDGTQIEIGG